MTMEDRNQNKTTAPSTKAHVGIIGAGIAGLRCADVLLQHGGFRVTIIEGRDRIGGRVHQTELLLSPGGGEGGHLVDMGPNWIHGTQDSPILDIAKRTGTVLGDVEDSTNTVDERGRLFDQADAEKYSTIMWGIVEDAFAVSKKDNDRINATTSLADFFEQQVKEKIPDSEPDCERQREIVLRMSSLWGAFVGSPIQRQSLKFFWLEESIEGENLFCAGTYKHILKAIAQPALDGADIKLNTRAQTITYGSCSGGGASVETSDGQSLAFDHLVVTAPLGWLKRNQSAFSPALPRRLSQAIDSIGYGCLEKVYITFPKAYWLPAGDNHAKGVEGFIQWLAPDYAVDSNPGKWNQEAFDLANLPSGVNHPTLLFYIFGEQSQHMVNELAQLPNEAEKAAFLIKWFRPYYSRLPNYSEISPDCKARGCVATNWLRDELAGNGSYSNFQIGLQRGDEDIAAMRRGLPEDHLWFAGEHTAPFLGLGTTTGAYWSGESVGRRIVEAHHIQAT